MTNSGFYAGPPKAGAVSAAAAPVNGGAPPGGVFSNLRDGADCELANPVGCTDDQVRGSVTGPAAYIDQLQTPSSHARPGLALK